MNLYCNGLFVSSNDPSALFDPEGSFDTVYGEPWFLQNEPFDTASLFPEKNTLRALSDVKTVMEYVTAAGVRGIDPDIYMIYSPLEKPRMNSTLELRIKDICRPLGYDILSLSVNYSLIYDVLEKETGEIDFSEEDTLSDRVEEFRARLNSSLLFDSPEDCRLFLEGCSAFFTESCEKLVIPGWEDLSVDVSFSGKRVDDNLICRVLRADREAFIALFKDIV
ncbi:MAG: hypothetical protein IJT95_00840 [Abditibacteriota bacterium]|nr:hypothetical protein [Abditibacteriota bacterium]